MLTALAHDYGIPLRDGPQDYQPRGTADRDWLIEQYVHCHRALPDLAREKGMSTSNMARWAKTHSIPLRPRGSASHNQRSELPTRPAEHRASSGSHSPAEAPANA